MITKEGKKLKVPIDITNNRSYASQVKRHFGYTNKLEYLDGKPLFPQSSNYKFTSIPSNVAALPNALDFNIDAVKSWFTTGKNLEWLCEPDKLNFDFTKLADSDEYKLLIEPVVYIRIPLNASDKVGSIYAMTATEGTLASQKDRQIEYNLAAILRRQIPISMYLEFDDMHLELDAYTGKTDWGKNEYIPYSLAMNQLGLGIIYFTELETEPPEEPEEPEVPDNDTELPKPGFDFSCDSLTIDTHPIREENDFKATSTFSYKQQVDCQSCTTTCSRCNLTGRYTVKVSDGYYSHYSYCNGYYGSSCSCSTYYVPPRYATRDCTLCYINCRNCDLGILWYSKNLPSSYVAPTKKVTLEVFVKDATPDYTNGTSGELRVTKTITMTADTSYELSALLNAGEGIGRKTVIARINWERRKDETNPNNNEGNVNISVIPATNLTLQYLPPNAPYRTGTEVMTSYLVLNKEDIGALNIRPKHGLVATLTVTNPKTGSVIAQKTTSTTVLPKGGSNLIYFKWKLPAEYRETSVNLTCQLNPSGSVKEILYSDNLHTATEQVQIFRQHITPDTVFENRPAGYQRPSGYEDIPTSKWAASVFNSVSYEHWEWASDYVKQKIQIQL